MDARRPSGSTFLHRAAAALLLAAMLLATGACSSTDSLAAATPTQVAYHFRSDAPPMQLRNEAAVASVERAYSDRTSAGMLKVASDEQMAALIAFFEDQGMFERSAPSLAEGASSHLVVRRGDQAFAWSRFGFDTVPSGMLEQYDTCREAFRVLYDSILGYSSGSMSGEELRMQQERLQRENQERLERLRRQGR